MLHDVPSHRSAIVPSELPALSKAAPTAMHAEGDVHETALRLAPATVGIGCRRQVVPSHRSATVDVTPLVGPVDPTPKHEVVDVQLTPFSCVSADPTGLDMGSRRHVVPSKLSAIASGVPAPLACPTAVHAVDDGHATPRRRLSCALDGLGVD
jgi:hypothetical protein